MGEREQTMPVLSSEITVEDLRDMIYEIRGLKVMLDSDLAKIYGYTTKAFNQQVKNNIAKFPDDFRFQLTWEEVETLSRSDFLTLNKEGRGKNIKYQPWCFTEQGYCLYQEHKEKTAI